MRGNLLKWKQKAKWKKKNAGLQTRLKGEQRQAINQASKQSSKQASKQSSKQSSKQASKQASKQSTINQASLNQPTNQSINQSINQSSINQSNQPINQSINQSTNQPINQSINTIFKQLGKLYVCKWAFKYINILSDIVIKMLTTGSNELMSVTHYIWLTNKWIGYKF